MIFPIGLLGAALAGAAVVPRWGWQWMFIMGAAPALVALVLRRFCPESPRWLASKGRLDEANAVLSKIEHIVSRGDVGRLPAVREIRVARSRTNPLADVPGSLLSARSWVGWRPPTASPMVCRAGSRSSIAGHHLSLQQSLNYAIAPAGSVLGFAPVRLAHRSHRPPVLVHRRVCSLRRVVALWAVAASTAFGMLLGHAFCSMWLGSVNMSIFLYTAEIYPTRMRALGVSWAGFWLRVAATGAPLIVAFALPRYGISGVFLVFSIFALTGCTAAIFMVETRQRVLEEVSP
jgi:putative MFS transporter